MVGAVDAGLCHVQTAVRSEMITSQADLGRVLAYFKPQTCPMCATDEDEQDEPTEVIDLQPQLVVLRDALNDLIDRLQSTD
jgi:hypothetical protein